MHSSYLSTLLGLILLSFARCVRARYIIFHAKLEFMCENSCCSGVGFSFVLLLFLFGGVVVVVVVVVVVCVCVCVCVCVF